jgi:DNA-directed RNA polymerase I subunit RPA1
MKRRLEICSAALACTQTPFPFIQTFEGAYKPFNRIGIDSNTSPFAKMSFETTMNFMRSAVLTGDYDTIESPSARLVVGRVVEGGTGCFDLQYPLKA